MKGKAKKIPSSKAELRRLLKRSKDCWLYAQGVAPLSTLFFCAGDVPDDALWAMPLADIAESKRSKKR